MEDRHFYLLPLGVFHPLQHPAGPLHRMSVLVFISPKAVKFAILLGVCCLQGSPTSRPYISALQNIRGEKGGEEIARSGRVRSRLPDARIRSEVRASQPRS
ncbi:hypothetical protein AtNW77_Chr2g0233071 [Arabidopsis thaliana]